MKHFAYLERIALRDVTSHFRGVPFALSLLFYLLKIACLVQNSKRLINYSIRQRKAASTHNLEAGAIWDFCLRNYFLVIHRLPTLPIIFLSVSIIY